MGNNRHSKGNKGKGKGKGKGKLAEKGSGHKSRSGETDEVAEYTIKESRVDLKAESQDEVLMLLQTLQQAQDTREPGIAAGVPTDSDDRILASDSSSSSSTEEAGDVEEQEEDEQQEEQVVEQLGKQERDGLHDEGEEEEAKTKTTESTSTAIDAAVSASPADVVGGRRWGRRGRNRSAATRSDGPDDNPRQTDIGENSENESEEEEDEEILPWGFKEMEDTSSPAAGRHQQKREARKLLQRLLREDQRENTHGTEASDSRRQLEKNINILVVPASAMDYAPKHTRVKHGNAGELAKFLKQVREPLGIKGRHALSAHIVNPDGRLGTQLFKTSDLSEGQLVAISVDGAQRAGGAGGPAEAASQQVAESQAARRGVQDVKLRAVLSSNRWLRMRHVEEMSRCWNTAARMPLMKTWQLYVLRGHNCLQLERRRTFAKLLRQVKL